MKKQTIGLLHPGAMGAAVGKALTSSEADVLWVSEQRSEMSRQRAEQANLRDAGSIENLVNQSNIKAGK